MGGWVGESNLSPPGEKLRVYRVGCCAPMLKQEDQPEAKNLEIRQPLGYTNDFTSKALFGYTDDFTIKDHNSDKAKLSSGDLVLRGLY